MPGDRGERSSAKSLQAVQDVCRGRHEIVGRGRCIETAPEVIALEYRGRRISVDAGNAVHYKDAPELFEDSINRIRLVGDPAGIAAGDVVEDMHTVGRENGLSARVQRGHVRGD